MLDRCLSACAAVMLAAWACVLTAAAEELPGSYSVAPAPPADLFNLEEPGFTLPPAPPPLNTAAFYPDPAEKDQKSEKDEKPEKDEKDEKPEKDEKAKDKGPSTEELQKELRELQKRIGELEDSDEELADLLDNAVKAGTKQSTMRLNGRIHLDYWGFGDTGDPGDDFLEGADLDPAVPWDPQDRFLFRRIRLGVEGQIQPNMVYKVDMEFPQPNDFEIRDVYLGFENLPVFQTLLIGNQKRPYGLDHINSSRYNVFMERPMVIEAFNEDTRRLGIVSYGVSDDHAWNWRYGVYNLERIQDDGEYNGDHYQGEAAGRLANTWFYEDDGRDYGHWAIAGAVAHPDATAGGGHSNEARFRTRPESRTRSRWLNTDRIDGAMTYELLGLEKVLNFGPLQLVGEYQNIWLQREGGAGSDLQFWGGYFYVAYMLTGEHVPWDRETGQLGRLKPFRSFNTLDPTRCEDEPSGWGAWQIAVRYSYLDLNNQDITGGLGENITVGLNWYWNANAKLQFNYIHGLVSDRGEDLPAGAPPLVSSEYDHFGIRGVVDF